MSDSLNEFAVCLEFSASGGVDKVIYWDQEGCGHEREMDDRGDRSLVAYHLGHYKHSHRLTPPKMCGFSVVIEGGGQMTCLKEHHDESSTHMFEY